VNKLQLISNLNTTLSSSHFLRNSRRRGKASSQGLNPDFPYISQLQLKQQGLKQDFQLEHQLDHQQLSNHREKWNKLPQ
jgi:hypothetical protein